MYAIATSGGAQIIVNKDEKELTVLVAYLVCSMTRKLKILLF